MNVSPLYLVPGNTDGIGSRWWVSGRQRVLIVTFDSVEDAEAWDENPVMDGLVIKS